MGKVLMPQMGFDMHEGKLVRWLKRPGDTVARNEPIAEIETDKAVLEIEAFESGTVTRLLVEEGQTVPVGTPIAIINGDDEQATEPAEGLGAPADAEAVERNAAASAPVPPAAEVADRRASDPTGAQASVPATATGAPAAPTGAGTQEDPAGDRIKASPLARRLAREYGIDLRNVRGTGPGGRIVKADIDAARTAATTLAPTPTPPAVEGLMVPSGRIAPLTAMRQVIARRMTESKQQAPHFYLTISVDMDAAMSFRRQFNEMMGGAVKASVNDLIVKACGLALVNHPSINASFTPEGIWYADSADVAFAVALKEGLITPVVRDAHTKGLDVIAAETRELAETARAGRLRPDQYQGGTFTVSNLGMYGIEEFVAIINPPQAAILAVGAITDTPVVRDGQITIRPIMRMTLSADHRVTDGAAAAEFLREVKAILEQPLRLLMPPRPHNDGAAKEESR